jgi:hypothetical protein
MNPVGLEITAGKGSFWGKILQEDDGKILRKVGLNAIK